jgi:hypothetical protein
VKRFLAVENYYGDEFYVPEDDEDNKESSSYDKDPPVVKPPLVNNSSFNFSDYEFARYVRSRVLAALAPFDNNNNEQFEEKEIA